MKKQRVYLHQLSSLGVSTEQAGSRRDIHRAAWEPGQSLACPEHPAAAASLPPAPLCHRPGTSQGWHCPSAKGEAVQLQTAGTPGKRSQQLRRVNGDVSTFRLYPAQPCSCTSEPPHLEACVQLSTKAVRTWRLKYLICLSRKDLLTQTRACDEILFTRQAWGWKSIHQHCCDQKLDSLSEQNSLKQAMPHITPFAWWI